MKIAFIFVLFLAITCQLVMKHFHKIKQNILCCDLKILQSIFFFCSFSQASAGVVQDVGKFLKELKDIVAKGIDRSEGHRVVSK